MSQRKHWRAPPPVQQRAKALRREQSPIERKLWARLRQKQLYGLKFRRQHPIGRFIVDFYCPAHKLIVEIDGRSHDERLAYDGERTAWLESQGYRVIRFTNEQVVRECHAVLEEIARVCGKEPPP